MMDDSGNDADRGQILVADDNRMNRLKLSHSLKQQGYRVALAEDGRQALEMLREQRFDVLLLDILMPEMDGFEVLTQMANDPELRHVPVIVISALDEVESAVRCIEMGAEDYLSKPVNPVLLRARLKASLRRKRLRDLEQAYMQQEVSLRQNEKLATLGRLSAGMAHELNNPAAAIQRGATQLQSAFGRLQSALGGLAAQRPTTEQLEKLTGLETRARRHAVSPTPIDPLVRSDQEEAVELWLEDAGVDNPWELAPNLVNMHLDADALTETAAVLSPKLFEATLSWLNHVYTLYSLMQEIALSAETIAGLVAAMKSYSYMDQAPIQEVDIHAGLENTLTILRGKIGPDVAIERQYDPNLPTIQAYGGQLNQVWTNLIDNALQSIDGSGVITIRTCHESESVMVEIQDDGPGIPEEIQPHLFDPFFTTKAPGEGTGMGLNICHNIIVQQHNGRLELSSHPGETCFQVRLPLNPPGS